jgi:hypothetical protein
MRKKRGYTMAIETYRRPAGTGLTPEEMAMLEERTQAMGQQKAHALAVGK